MMVIEKKRMIIFKGLTLVGAINWSYISLIGDKEKIIRIMAPTKAITQWVAIFIFPIFIYGKKMIDKVINKNVIREIINVGII